MERCYPLRVMRPPPPAKGGAQCSRKKYSICAELGLHSHHRRFYTGGARKVTWWTVGIMSPRQARLSLPPPSSRARPTLRRLVRGSGSLARAGVLQ